jgi:four helix bundle protein
MSYQKLEVWQKSIELVTEIYGATKIFPKEEAFGLISQMRRSAVSIPSNIAEGYGRKNPKENKQFVNIAYGSALELETQIIISEKLNISIFDWQTIKNKLEEVKKMLYKYREYSSNY